MMSTLVTEPRTNQPAANDEAAVSALPARIAAAWAEGDADKYAELFTEDADYVVFDGSLAKGRRAIADVHRPVFETFMKGSRMAINSVRLRFLGPEVALIHTSGGVLRGKEIRPSKRQLSVQTMVAIQGDDGWLITAFQNTRYRPFSDTLVWKVGHALPFGPFKQTN